jgi:molybdopterin/thiamine biosynthesis adenylyltransferase
MPGKFHHEAIYRGEGLVERLAGTPIVLCGVGAVGSLLADQLARQGARRLRAIDRDRVEEHNVGTQLFGENEVGAPKVEALRNRLFRALGVEIEALPKELNDRNAAKLLAGAALVIDAFDNAASRRLVQTTCRAGGLECLHVGLNGGYAEVIWDESYRVPGDVGDDTCDYPLARNLVGLAVAVASEAILRWLADGTRGDRSITLGDLAIRSMEAPLPVDVVREAAGTIS